MSTYNNRNKNANVDHVEISQWDPSTAAYDIQPQPTVAQTTEPQTENSHPSATGSESAHSSSSWYDMSLQVDPVHSAEWGVYDPPVQTQTWSTAENYGGNYQQNRNNYSSQSYNIKPQEQQVKFAGFNDQAYPGQHSKSSGYDSYRNYEKSYQSQNYSAPIRPANIHSNPLMDDEDEDDEALVNQLKNQRLYDKSKVLQMPKMLSKSALNMLKKDLDQASEIFKSPDLLKLARKADLGLLDSTKDESALENAIKSLAESSNLSALAHSFVPITHQNNDAAVNMIEEFVYAVSIDPGEFHSQTSEILDYFNSQKLSKSDITKMVNVIITNALLVDNFKYLGAKFSNNLCQLSNFGKDFRGQILTALQSKYKETTANLENETVEWPSIQSFIMVLAEFYMHLQINKVPITVLGKFLVQMLRKTLDKNFQINFLQVIKIIKLTGGLLDGDMASKTELDGLLYHMGTLKSKENGSGDGERYSLAYTNLKTLRETNWGRRESQSEVKSDHANQPETNDNFYMNEAIYFTEDGKPYTYADQEFQNDVDEPFDPNNYVGDDDEHLFEDDFDEYDDDFEKFLKESGQYKE